MVSLGVPFPSVVACITFQEWLSWTFDNYCSFKHTEIGITIWALWYARNKLIHEGKNQGIGDLTTFIHGYCSDFLQHSGHQSQLPSQSLSIWTPPPTGIIKINVDVGFQLPQKRACSGVILRNDKGFLMGACCHLTWPVCNSFVAEAVAVIHGLRFAAEMGFK